MISEHSRGRWCVLGCLLTSFVPLSVACGERYGATETSTRDGVQGVERGPGTAGAVSSVLPGITAIDGAEQRTLSTTLPSDCTFKDIAAGTTHTCAVQTSGRVSCWGDSSRGALGIGYNFGGREAYRGLIPFPVTVMAASEADPNVEGAPLSDVVHVATIDADARWDGTLAIRSDGSTWHWGFNLGFPNRVTDTNYVALGPLTSLFGGGAFCGIDAAGALWCTRAPWWTSVAGFGDPWPWLEVVRVPTAVGTFTGATSASNRQKRRCATKTDGSVWCWGPDAPAKTCTAGSASYPAQVFTAAPSTYLTGMRDVQNGNGFSCALRATGTVHCWGADFEPYGVLGDGTTMGTSTSVKCDAADVTDGTATLSGVTTLATGYNHSCALKTDGTVWCWGGNSKGQLGDGTQIPSAVAKKVVMSDGSALTSITRLSASLGNTCAVRADGAAFCWGAGGSQQIGDGYGADRANPTQVRCLECFDDVDCKSGSPQSAYGNLCVTPDRVCGECRTNSDCAELTPTRPICNRAGARAKCEACGGDYGGRGSNQCPAESPICAPSGSCAIACVPGGATYPSSCATDTAGEEELCVTSGRSAGRCTPCDGDYLSGATRACGAFRPVCASGACVGCGAANATACNGARPACDTATATCAACASDYGAPSGASCPSLEQPWCAGGECGRCVGDADCVGHAGGSVCNTSTGYCGTPCVADLDCNSAPHCSENRCWCQGAATKVCIPKAPNGVAISGAAPISGVCTVANGQRACVSGVCDATTNRCGLPQGAPCGPPATNASCRSGVCSPSDFKCGSVGGEACQTTADCRVGLCADGECRECGYDADCKDPTKALCDTTTHTCRSCTLATQDKDCRAAKLSACALSGPNAGKCVMCTATDVASCSGPTPVCDVATNTCIPCGGSFGQGGSTACPASAPLCNPDGRCVLCTIDAQCAGRAEGQVCNVADGRCVTCVTDAQCAGRPEGNLCDAATNRCVMCMTDAQCHGRPEGERCNPATLRCEPLPPTPNTNTGASGLPEAAPPVPADDDGCSISSRRSGSPSSAWGIIVVLGLVLALRRRAAA